MNTYNIETLTRHPNPPDTYETTFCGGDIIQTHETWQAAEIAALGILDRNSDGQTIYVTERGKDGAASPLIRWQCFRVWRGKKTVGDVVDLCASIRTESGKTTVYHKIRSGAPEIHEDDGGPWYYEPTYWNGGDVFSPGYPTREAAIAAAEQSELDAESERDQADEMEGR